VALRPWEIDNALATGQRINVPIAPTTLSINPFIPPPTTTTRTTTAAAPAPAPAPAPRPPTPYPTTLPPLSPEMLRALQARRAQSARVLAESEAMFENQRQRAELDNIGRLLDIEEDVSRQGRVGMNQLAGQGLARSPMYANPFRRELARTQQREQALAQSSLADTLEQLNNALTAARQRREYELSQIAFDEAAARSNIQRLMGLA
jgi:hypothetical protein